MLAKIGARVCNCLGDSRVCPDDFITDFAELARQSSAPQIPQTADDIASQLRAMGLPVVMGNREGA